MRRVQSYQGFRSGTHLEYRKRVQLVSLLADNVSYAHRLPKIIELLKKVDADVLLLQELDMHNKRTGDVDVCMEIAKALQMNFVYVVEYEELYSRHRTPELQGGGVHGAGTTSASRSNIQLCFLSLPYGNQKADYTDTSRSCGDQAIQ